MTEREEVRALVLEFFKGDVAKTDLWMTIENPLTGHISPEDLLVIRPGKLLKVVRDALAENEPPPPPIKTSTFLDETLAENEPPPPIKTSTFLDEVAAVISKDSPIYDFRLQRFECKCGTIEGFSLVPASTDYPKAAEVTDGKFAPHPSTWRQIFAARALAFQRKHMSCYSN